MDDNLINTKVREDLINNLIRTEFISLKEEDLLKYNCEDILQESLNTIKSLKNNLTNSNTDEIKDNKDEKSETKGITPPSRRSSTSSFGDSSIIAKDIPKKYLENPIDFVNYIEYELPNDKKNKVNDKFIIKQYEENNDIKFEITNIINDKEINNIVFSKNEIITLIYYYGQDLLITGNILGQIKIFSLIDRKQIKQIECPFTKESSSVQITTLDLNKDNKFIFIGYSNGYISFADIKSTKIRLVIKDIIKDSECLCIKFLNQEGKIYRILVSDQLGNIFLIVIKDGLTRCKVIESQIIYENKENNILYPIYMIKFLEFNEEISKKNEFLENINKYIIFGSLKNFKIFSLNDNKELNLIHKIGKPEWIKDYIVSDICFGIGQHPQSRENFDENEDAPQILMCICFDNIINLYIIPLDNNEITFPVLIGHYLNFNDEGDNNIIRIGFMAKGCIYLIDKSNHFKILDTKKFIKGNANKNKETSIENKSNKLIYKKVEIQKVHKFKSEINYQINIKTPKNNYKKSYMNSISQNFISNNLVILCNKYIYIIDFVNYEYYLKDLQKKQKWMEMFILGIDIYKGKITSLKGIPQNSDERKKKLRDYLEQLISLYIIADDMIQKKEENNSDYEAQKYLKYTEEKIDMIIEFCMEIEGFDYLLDKIMKIYESKKFGDLLLLKLESFIICDKLLKYKIDEKLILRLIELYESRNKTYKLNKILLHIDIQSLISPSVKRKINELNLFSPMMTILVNGENPDFFKPILLLYEMYEKAKKLNFFSYENIIDKKDLEEIKESKEYKGDKLFWYIEKSFTKRKYPYFIYNMEDDEYNKYIIDLTFWLIKENIMKELIETNSELYFDILNKIFNNEKNLKIIESISHNEKKMNEKIKILNEQNYNYTYENLTPLSLFNYIIEQGKKIEGEQKTKLDFNLFIIQSSKNISIEKDVIITSIIFILDVYNIINKTMDNKTKRVINTIINVLNNNENFTDTDYENILLHFSAHIFDEIKAFIYERTKKYKNCIELFLDKNCIISDKGDKLCKYINKIFYFLEKENGALYSDFKNLILDNIANIGEISKDTMIKIIYDYFYRTNEDKKLIMEKLEKKPKLQFVYIEPLYKQFIFEYKEQKKEQKIIIEDEQFAQSILGLYIKLLCITGQKERVIKCLKESNLFPCDYCRKICEQYDVKNALIYLYQVSGDFQNALKFSFEMIDIHYNSISNNLISDIFKEKDFNKQIIDFNSSVEQSLEILTEIQNHKTDEELELSDSGKEWFDILNKLYDITIKFDKILSSLSLNRKNFGNEFENALSDRIILTLEKMSLYIGIKRILEEISKNKIAGYKEFKPLLYKILETYDIQNSILLSSTKLFKNLCFENCEEFISVNKEGNIYNINKCSICGNNFEKIKKYNEKKILVFNCGHKMHVQCSKTEKIGNDDIIICPICKKKEIELDIFHLNNFNINDTKYEEEKKIKKLNKDNIDIKIYRDGFIRMNNINNNIINKNKNFFNECIEAREKLRLKRKKRNYNSKKKK